MCGFQVGDEVVCVDASKHPFYPRSGLVEGAIYTVRRVLCGGRAVHLFELLSGPERNGLLHRGFRAERFRKVQRRDLNAWLATENTIEDPKRIRETESA